MGTASTSGVDPIGQVDRADDRPPYRQIADMLRQAIADGVYGPGERLPSEAKLVSHFGVARMTARQAMSELRNDGLVFSQHGRGVFVRHPADHRSARANLDDVVALSHLIQEVIGRALRPEESSRLKSAYQANTTSYISAAAAAYVMSANVTRVAGR